MRFRLDSQVLLEGLLDKVTVSLEDIRGRMPVRIHSLMRATGMSYSKIIDFLNSNDIDHVGFLASYDAVEALKDWYLKKMRRYVRNGLAQELVPGSTDEMLFLWFCAAYRKFGHQEVKSWDDIDELRLLQNFEESCLNEYVPLFSIEPRGTDSLLSRIHRSFLFHLRLKNLPKHNECRVKTILSIILCNRYHIYTAEADPNADYSSLKANWPCEPRINPPRRTAPYVLASWA